MRREPAAPTPAPSAAPLAPAAGPGADAPLHGTVLYIEDVPLNFVVVQGILARHPGVRLLHAETGVDGVRQVLESMPDFVLLDMHLPDISGLEVVRRLSEAIASRRLRVTILTADSLTMDVIKAMSLGAFEYLVKPVDAALLEAAVRRALGDRRADGDAARRR